MVYGIFVGAGQFVWTCTVGFGATYQNIGPKYDVKKGLLLCFKALNDRTSSIRVGALSAKNRIHVDQGFPDCFLCLSAAFLPAC